MGDLILLQRVQRAIETFLRVIRPVEPFLQEVHETTVADDVDMSPEDIRLKIRSHNGGQDWETIVAQHRAHCSDRVFDLLVDRTCREIVGMNGTTKRPAKKRTNKR